MSPIGKDSRALQSGFTLIEIVCVLSIVAMLAAVVWPIFSSNTSKSGLERMSVEIAALLINDRTAAMRNQTFVATHIEKNSIITGLSSRRLNLPRDVSIYLDAQNRCVTENAFIFSSDGLSCAQKLRLTAHGSSIDIISNALTGGIEIVSPH
jgi:general secretion pathway protein H